MYRRVQGQPAKPEVFDAANVAAIMREWGGAQHADELAARTRWRDQRLAALAAHKRTQSHPESLAEKK
jgi:hypothetical protein